MPLRATDDPAKSIESVQKDIGDAQFLVFFSSRTSGKLWCPDCVRVEQLVLDTFGNEDAPKALIVYVGQRAEWKSSSNVFRGEPWKVSSVPTILRLSDGAQLVDSEIQGDSLASFSK
ncbi:hypothetical protein C8Q75DRAFT_726212 [Abortiporus biennis]|nr:hypothetical protein C8Q75DRAFT_726212 [Abortiporus biennis]